MKAIRLDTMDVLSRALDCQPGDLFEYVPEQDRDGLRGVAMAEETTAETRVLALLSRMEERQEAGFEQVNERIRAFRDVVEARFNGLEQRTARLEGGFEQMDKRMSDLSARMSSAESLQRWAIGLIITSWLTLVGLFVTMLFKMP